MSLKTSVDIRYQEQVKKLKLEYESLKNEFAQNNQTIRDLQIRDLESVEKMKYFLDKKRQLNDRAKKLKQLILKNFLDRKGSNLKIEEWISAFNIPVDFKTASDPSTKSFHDSHSDTNISEFEASVRPKTDDFLEQLAFKVENILNHVSCNELGNPDCENPDKNNPHYAISDAETGSIHIEKSSEIKFSSIESILRQCQYDAQKTPPKSSDPAPSFPTPERYVSPSPRINYPDNVNLKPANSPPTPGSTAPLFTTKYEIKRKRKSTATSPTCKPDRYKLKCKQRKNNHDFPKQFLVKPVTPNSSSTICTKFLNFFYTVTAIMALGTLFYHCPTPAACLEVLKNTMHQTKDDLADTLTYINLPNLLNNEPIKDVEELNSWQQFIKFLENWYLQLW